MNCKSMLIAASALLSALMMESAEAGSMRCGSHIISSGGLYGPDKYEVLKKCGEPAARYGNTWVYELSGGTKRVVAFDQTGKVSRID
jgi:hypothetical protein